MLLTSLRLHRSLHRSNWKILTDSNLGMKGFGPSRRLAQLRRLQQQSCGPKTPSSVHQVPGSRTHTLSLPLVTPRPLTKGVDTIKLFAKVNLVASPVKSAVNESVQMLSCLKCNFRDAWISGSETERYALPQIQCKQLKMHYSRTRPRLVTLLGLSHCL